MKSVCLRTLLLALLLPGTLLLAACNGDDRSTSPEDEPPSDSFIGDPGLPPVVEITNATADFAEGQADNVDTLLHRVVLWAKTDRWYVQPLADAPFTSIGSDGHWSSATNPWERIVAVLAGPGYHPPATFDLHPSMDPNVLAWDEYPDTSLRTVSFSGWDWQVKSAEEYTAGPGPNYFSNRESAVWLEGNDLLLSTEHREGKWFSSEVFLSDPTGYGVYTFELGSRVDNLDERAVFAGFLYEGANQEIDFEFSPSLVGQGHNAQYVVQPWNVAGNITRYTLPPLEVSSYRLEWREDRITWSSWRGGLSEQQPDSLIYTWTYDGPWNPTPDGERFHFNLWFLNGDDPAGGVADTVRIHSFDYHP